MTIIEYMGKKPQIPESAFVAPGAVLIGSVILGENASIWFNSVLRGDINYIKVGDMSNIQDCCVIHVEDERPTLIGSRVTIGHGALLHACTIEDDAHIGMGAILLNGCKIGSKAAVAAGALIPMGMEVPPGSLVIGVPGKVKKTLTPEEIEANGIWAPKYNRVSKNYKDK